MIGGPYMKERNKTTCELSRKLVSKMIKKDSEGWPPECGIFVYQPMRPHKQPTILEEASNRQQFACKEKNGPQ